jgi:DNA-binding transcriptional MerR regulator
MSKPPDECVIPDRPSFKASEVCELLQLQPYVLRSWESEFANLGVARTPGGPRVYRRADVELAVRIRQLVFGDGLTLAGVRRRLEEERPAVAPGMGAAGEDDAAESGGPIPAEARARIERAKKGLRGVLAILASSAAAPSAAPGPPTRALGADAPRAAAPAGDLFAFESPGGQERVSPGEATETRSHGGRRHRGRGDGDTGPRRQTP